MTEIIAALGLAAVTILNLSTTGSTQIVNCRSGSSNYAIGETRCVLFSQYNDHQWATCLTDNYIQRASNGDHQCRDRTATVCWYQCQLEVNRQSQGLVDNNCRCSNTGLSTTPAVVAPTLSPECLSPGVLRCDWYRECLEVRYPCQGTEDGYAIEYAQKYCNLYSDNYNDFSSAGRQWVDAVRNCLQRELIPTLRPFEVNTCADIRKRAFDSHSSCYTNPAPGTPSICNIPCRDVWKVFWIVNRWSDSAIISAPVETGKQMLEVVIDCFGIDGCVRDVVTTTVVLSVPLLKGVRAAYRVGRYIAQRFKFDANNIGWFPYSNDEDSHDNNRQRRNIESPTTSDEIVMLLVDLQLLDISNSTVTSTRSPGSRILEETITALGDAVSNGDLSQIPVEVNGTVVIFGISGLGRCGDTLCKNSANVISLANAPPPTTKGSALKVGVLCESTILLSALTLYYL